MQSSNQSKGGRLILLWRIVQRSGRCSFSQIFSDFKNQTNVGGAEESNIKRYLYRDLASLVEMGLLGVDYFDEEGIKVELDEDMRPPTYSTAQYYSLESKTEVLGQGLLSKTGVHLMSVVPGAVEWLGRSGPVKTETNRLSITLDPGRISPTTMSASHEDLPFSLVFARFQPTLHIQKFMEAVSDRLGRRGHALLIESPTVSRYKYTTSLGHAIVEISKDSTRVTVENLSESSGTLWRTTGDADDHMAPSEEFLNEVTAPIAFSHESLSDRQWNFINGREELKLPVYIRFGEFEVYIS